MSLHVYVTQRPTVVVLLYYFKKRIIVPLARAGMYLSVLITRCTGTFLFLFFIYVKHTHTYINNIPI